MTPTTPSSTCNSTSEKICNNSIAKYKLQGHYW